MGKKIILMCLIITGILFGFNLNQNNQEGKSFLLKGNIKGLNKASVKLLYFNREDFKTITIDSGSVEDGKFELKGSVGGPREVSLVFAVEGKSLVGNLFIENSNIQVQLDTSKYNYVQGNYKWLTCKVTGSKTQEEYDNYLSLGKEFRDKLKPYQEEYHRLSVQFNSIKNKSNNVQMDSLINKVKDIDALMAGISSKLDSIDENYIKTDPASQISSYLLSQKIKDIGLKKDIAYYNAFTPEVKDGVYGISVSNQIEKLKKASPGAAAPLFSKEDVNGNKINLKDFRGKYVLLDFWASWCVPCRAGHPHLIELYNKYHNKGLEIIGIGDDDYTQSAWKEAIEKDGIGIWYQVLRGYKRDSTTYRPVDQGLDGPYDVSSIPAHFLIDKNGIIIGRYAEETAALDAKLKEIFGE